MIKAVSQIHGGNGLFNKQQWVNLRAIYKFSKPENDINPDSGSLINPNKCTHTHTHTHHKPHQDIKVQKTRKNQKILNTDRGKDTVHTEMGFPGGSVVKNPPASAGDMGLIPVLGISPGERNGNPLQYSCLENPMDRGTSVGHDCATEHAHTQRGTKKE